MKNTTFILVFTVLFICSLGFCAYLIMSVFYSASHPDSGIGVALLLASGISIWFGIDYTDMELDK